MEQTVFLDTLVRLYLRLKCLYSDLMSDSCHLYSSRMSKLVMNVKYLLLLSFLSSAKF